jgi:hypothetical protein
VKKKTRVSAPSESIGMNRKNAQKMLKEKRQKRKKNMLTISDVIMQEVEFISHEFSMSKRWSLRFATISHQCPL